MLVSSHARTFDTTALKVAALPGKLIKGHSASYRLACDESKSLSVYELAPVESKALLIKISE
jgi:hypothetical protein